MRTTLNVDDGVLEGARRLIGITGKTEFIHAGLRALMAQAARKRLAKMAGSQPTLRPVRRPRTRP